MKPIAITPFLITILIPGVIAFAGTEATITKEVKSEAESWELKLALPAWAAAARGDSGINGSTSHSVIGLNEIANKIDLAGAFRAELSRGKFGAILDFSYFSLSDSVGVGGTVRKVDSREDELLSELGARWRVIDNPHGYLDFIGGVRYTYLYEKLTLQSDDGAITDAARQLAVAGTLLRLGLLRELDGLDGDRKIFSGPALGAGERERLLRAIEGIRGSAAERADKIDKLLKNALNRSLSRVDDWFDPYIGLRGHYNFTDSLYFTGRAEISPFDVGADFAWQAYAGFGCQLSNRTSCDLVYRVLDVDYRHDGLIYDMTSYGPELTLWLSF